MTCEPRTPPALDEILDEIDTLIKTLPDKHSYTPGEYGDGEMSGLNRAVDALQELRQKYSK